MEGLTIATTSGRCGFGGREAEIECFLAEGEGGGRARLEPVRGGGGRRGRGSTVLIVRPVRWRGAWRVEGGMRGGADKGRGGIELIDIPRRVGGRMGRGGIELTVGPRSERGGRSGGRSGGEGGRWGGGPGGGARS